jgi:hypothetical protein
MPVVAAGMVQPVLRLARRLRWRKRLPWLVFLTCGAALITTDRLLDARRRRELAAEQAYQAQSFRIWARVVRYEGAGRATVSKELNGGRPLVGPQGVETLNLAPAAPSELFRYGVPATNPSHLYRSLRAEIRGTDLGPEYAGWVLHMHFVDDRLIGAYTVSPPRTAYVAPPPAWVVLRRLEPIVMWAAAVIWAGCLLIVPFNLPWRRDIGQVALAAVLVAALVAWLDPAALPGAVPHYAARALAGAALVAIGLVALPRGRTPRPDAPCAACGYDLTGNVSGVCPECGTTTPQGRIDRWRDEAERIAHVDEVAAEAAQEDVQGGEEPIAAEIPRSS